ncbi:FRG domain-containing protein [Roseovarius nitratireducens]|uniref:FRG domain-containing protein n=1 Tax=Roseovarius nitratireducens TaxID=2044597 RepID=UPI000CE1C364|nr:FRG domain-containing protein [Roseovarius nitratireducens]
MEKFSGQWIGTLSGTQDGLVLLDLDHRKQWLEGSIYGFLNADDGPNVYAPLIANPVENKLEFKVRPIALHPNQPRVAAAGEFATENFPAEISISIELATSGAEGTWKADNGQEGTLKLTKSAADQPSQLVAEPGIHDWASFQQEVAKNIDRPYATIFRGQSSAWRLRTAFHRTRRKDLVRYWEEDVPRLRKASVGHLGNTFGHMDPGHNGAFLHLLQHHGYPTPMLDWTYSPYIAAYFAYSSFADNFHSNSDTSGKVRIYMFDAHSWKLDFNQIVNLTHCRPHFSLIEPLAIANPRALPQQSVASISNVDDIEGYITYQESLTANKYLKVYDLPQSEYEDVLRQLGYMGISPGSLFPGIEGLCREYRHRQFGYDP